jgi:PmbA protein
VVGAGEDATEDMIAAMKRGIVVDQTLGSGQSNILAGEISVNVELGFLIENGEVRGRVKDCMVAGNVYDLLSRVEGVGSERQWIGAEFVPAICVGGIKLAAQG